MLSGERLGTSNIVTASRDWARMGLFTSSTGKAEPSSLLIRESGEEEDMRKGVGLIVGNQTRRAIKIDRQRDKCRILLALHEKVSSAVFERTIVIIKEIVIRSS